MRAILDREIPLGHSASQAPVLVQLPKPSSSIWFTIANTLSLALILPCGSNAYCEILALTNRLAEAFLQAATHAPQPIQAAAAKADSALSLSTGSQTVSDSPGFEAP